MKILIADDDPVSLLLLGDLLEDEAYEVSVARSGTQALEMLSLPDAPTLAIVDWLMPGLDGIEVCQAIRTGHQERYIYLIMMTARSFNDPELMAAATAAGVDDFIGKPLQPDELRLRVRAGRRIVGLDRALRARLGAELPSGMRSRLISDVPELN